MGSINNLPVGATMVEQFGGIIDKPDAWTHGKQVFVARYSDYCSKGYKSKYEHVLTEFLVVRIEGERTKCKMFSGKRIANCSAIYAGWKRDLEPWFKKESEAA